MEIFIYSVQNVSEFVYSEKPLVMPSFDTLHGSMFSIARKFTFKGQYGRILYINLSTQISFQSPFKKLVFNLHLYQNIDHIFLFNSEGITTWGMLAIELKTNIF